MRPQWWDSFESFPDVEAFYAAAPDEDRRRSGESDFGCWWWEGKQGYSSQYRVSCVERTGEIIAVCERPWGREGGHVVVLGSVGPDVRYTRSLALLDGWEQICGLGESLEWVVNRVLSLARPAAPVEVARPEMLAVFGKTLDLLEALKPWDRLDVETRRLCVELTLSLAGLPGVFPGVDPVAAPADPV